MSNLCTAYDSRMRALWLEAVNLCGKRHLKSNLHPLPYFYHAQTQTQFSTHTPTHTHLSITTHSVLCKAGSHACISVPSHRGSVCNKDSAVFCARSSILASNKLMGNCSPVCWDWFVGKMFHFLDTGAVKERFHHSCQHHLADFTINVLIICLQRELQPQFFLQV